MTRHKLENILKQFTFRYRVTEFLFFIRVEVSNKKNADKIDYIVYELKQLGVIHEVKILKFWQCWFPIRQWKTINK